MKRIFCGGWVTAHSGEEPSHIVVAVPAPEEQHTLVSEGSQGAPDLKESTGIEIAREGELKCGDVRLGVHQLGDNECSVIVATGCVGGAFYPALFKEFANSSYKLRAARGGPLDFVGLRGKPAV